MSARRSADASETSAAAAVRSADAAEKSAEAELALLELERQDRSQADLERRSNIWRTTQVDEAAWSIRLDAPVAYRVDVDTHGSAVRASRPGVASGPMFRNDHLVLETKLVVWDRRITVVWAESDDEDAEILRKPLVL